jgi:CRP/FNR family transcriptional regulator, cyclic AMP receptor protein
MKGEEDPVEVDLVGRVAMDLETPAVVRLLKQSAFSRLSEASLSDLLRHSQVLEAPAGSLLYRGDGPARLALLVHGVARVWIAGPKGRETTIRYAKAGDLLGVPTFLAGAAPVNVSAIAQCKVHYFDAGEVTRQALSDPVFALALGRECAFNLYDVIDRMRIAAFGSVRTRTIRHLLDLAIEQGGEQTVVATVQDLALAVGSVREMVSRTLSELRSEGLIASRNGAIVLIDSKRLRELQETDVA